MRSSMPRAMRMTESRILLRVETPNALPLILGGLRTATAADRRDRHRSPQPFLGDEVALESSSAAGSERSSHSRFEARHERGDPSPTVEG